MRKSIKVNEILHKVALFVLFLEVKVKSNEWDISKVLIVVSTVLLEIAVASGIIIQYLSVSVTVMALVGGFVFSAVLGTIFGLLITKLILLTLKVILVGLKKCLKLFKLEPIEFMQKLSVLGCNPSGKQNRTTKAAIVEYDNLFGSRVTLLANKEGKFSMADYFAVRENKEVNDIEFLLQNRRIQERYANFISAVKN